MTETLTVQDTRDMLELAAQVGGWFTPERFYKNTLRPEIEGRAGVTATIADVITEWAATARMHSGSLSAYLNHLAATTNGAPVTWVANSLIEVVDTRVFLQH